MHFLDHVIWHALNSRQEKFALSRGDARRFDPDVAPFAALPQPGFADSADMKKLVPAGQSVALFTESEIESPPGWESLRAGPLLQMLWQQSAQESNADTTPTPVDNRVERLGAEHSAEMIALTTLARPGPFGPRTHELGDYYGIRDNGVLVGMAGERLKVPGFTEVSAVCTHPDHTGKGYAAALMRRVMAGIRARGETPFLHSRADNDRAIALYERLGFAPRLRGYVLVLQRSAA